MTATPDPVLLGIADLGYGVSVITTKVEHSYFGPRYITRVEEGYDHFSQVIATYGYDIRADAESNHNRTVEEWRVIVQRRRLHDRRS